MAAATTTTALVYLTVMTAAVASSAAFGAAELTADYYSETCPQALGTIKFLVGAAILSEPRMGASLVRLHFHDCYVNVSST
jgi:peroxidase